MAITSNAPIPRAPISEQVRNPQTSEDEQILTLPFQIFFRTMRSDLDTAPRLAIPTPVTEAAAHASVATSDIVTPSVDGLYSFQYYAEVVTADGVSSSLTPVLGWTSGGVAKTKSFTAMTGDTTTTTASDDYLIFADANAPITYTLTYASNTPAKMVYNFYAVLNSVAGV